MKIDTEIEVGQNVYYLSGCIVHYVKVRKVEIVIEAGEFSMVYYLEDGASVARNNYPAWGGIPLFKNKEELLNFIENQCKIYEGYED
mgnify:CR=1 FL=1|jgi:hypothetical protein